MSTTTALSRAISPDPVLRQQVLVDTVHGLAHDQRDDLVQVLRQALHDAVRGTATALEIDVTALLFAAAVADRHHLAGHIETFEERRHSVELHEQTSGHDYCCGGHCACVRGSRLYADARCGDCQAAPHAVLDDAVRDLNAFLITTVGESTARDMAGAA